MNRQEIATLKTEIKRANQRLRQLEKSGKTSSQAYKSIANKFGMSKSYLTTTKKGEMKFRTDVSKMTKSELKNLSKQTKSFLEMKTSTVKGLKKSQTKGFETVKKKVIGEMNLTEKEYRDLWADNAIQSQKNVLGSDRVQQLILKGQENLTPDEIIERFEKSINENMDFRATVKDAFGMDFDDKGNISFEPVSESETNEIPFNVDIIKNKYGV